MKRMRYNKATWNKEKDKEETKTMEAYQNAALSPDTFAIYGGVNFL